MAYNKATYNDETIFDLSEDTVTSSTLLKNETAHNSVNQKITGSVNPVLTVNSIAPDSNGDLVLSAGEGISIVDNTIQVATPTYITDISSIITVNSANATIRYAIYTQCGKIVTLRVAWTNLNEISVPASGNIGNYTVGTIVEGKRPLDDQIYGFSSGDNFGFCSYVISNAGALQLASVYSTGATRTIAVNSSFLSYFTYILS